jgi:hypothetical protein
VGVYVCALTTDIEKNHPSDSASVVLRMFAFARKWTNAQHILQLIAQCLIMIRMYCQMAISNNNEWCVFTEAGG